ncbi:M10 family metallopeptidase C-terminal domain-containing protein [Niveispirillum sp. BGYR6]|uniref:M10 family metallopeptidase C-terminal domain-containing protein n=1 Tax=Niveispirillum sp. BGYR6 TaxID=2971249 RepID=UPI0022B97009|nr:M10 family metallopeptidase C-terminal domain-containing protein [Niveispirillum sp. BGYR6]MDG5497955.1 M10 family metallopeptidase C-terminal domain-containing protein [Niveispirillum sp. BGYR6]
MGIFDLAVIHYIYGPNKDVRSGADTYILSSTEVGRYIWDGGGNDTITAQDATQAVTIDLRDGGWGWFGSKNEHLLTEGQFFIGYGSVIENAVGGHGNDMLIGNKADNSLTGGAGNDTLVGGDGTDTAIFTGSYGSYSIGGEGRETRVTGSNGEVDTLIGIEWLKFDDRTVAVPANPDPVLIINPASVLERDDGGTGTESGISRLVYHFTLSATAATDISFTVHIAGGSATAGTDYKAVADQKLTIPAGTKSLSFSINVLGDRLLEGNETIQLLISDIKGARLPGAASSQIVTGTIMDDDATDPFFTTEAYAIQNPDVVAALGQDDAVLIRHYIQYGRAEGRATHGADMAAYAALNPDLFKIFGFDEPALTRHYQAYGRLEQRPTFGFDAEAYAALNPDLFSAFGLDKAALVRHYVNNGQAEGRVTLGFDADAYAALNPDLFNAFGLNHAALVSHYANYGRAEGRQATGFDVESYAVLNPDLLDVFGYDPVALVSHYIHYGRIEGRQAFSPSPAIGMMAENSLGLVGMVEGPG